MLLIGLVLSIGVVWLIVYARRSGDEATTTALDLPQAPSLPALAKKNRKRKPPNYDIDVTWTEEFDPPLTYDIEYADRHGEFSQRRIQLARRGRYGGHLYLGVFQEGMFKTLRADRVLKMLPVSENQNAPAPVHPSPAALLPPWPTEGAVFRVPSISGNRHWTVDLNAYTCTCPEKKWRTNPGSLGWVCPHMARAIRDNLPPAAAWDPKFLEFLAEKHPL